MVKVEGLSSEEKEAQSKLIDLVRIANSAIDMPTGIRVFQPRAGSNVLTIRRQFQGGVNLEAYVHIQERVVYVPNSDMLRDATLVAEAFETSGEPEYTVKKLYE
jgi:hypothetical protein